MTNITTKTMKAGKITAKLRDAVPVSFMVDGSEAFRFRNIEIPDSLKQLEITRFGFHFLADDSIEFQLHFQEGVLPKEKPANRESKRRTPKDGSPVAQAPPAAQTEAAAAAPTPAIPAIAAAPNPKPTLAAPATDKAKDEKPPVKIAEQPAEPKKADTAPIAAKQPETKPTASTKPAATAIAVPTKEKPEAKSTTKK